MNYDTVKYTIHITNYKQIMKSNIFVHLAQQLE